MYMKIHPLVVEIFQSGPKWRTNQLTDQHCHPESHNVSGAKKQYSETISEYCIPRAYTEGSKIKHVAECFADMFSMNILPFGRYAHEKHFHIMLIKTNGIMVEFLLKHIQCRKLLEFLVNSGKPDSTLKRSSLWTYSIVSSRNRKHPSGKINSDLSLHQFTLLL